jgi:hypothetical protein
MLTLVDAPGPAGRFAVHCCACRMPWQRLPHRKEQSMLDVILLAVGLGFFALSIAYVYACDRL